jgi:hypothetical protein
MGIFYEISDKELLLVRNKIFTEVGIPALEKNGFVKSPFLGTWFGEYDRNISGYSYELCRLSQNYLEIIGVFIVKGDKWIKIHLNIFELKPTVNSLKELKDVDGLQFHLPPNSITEMRLRTDDYKGPPLFYMLFFPEHKIGKYYSKKGFDSKVKKLKELIKKDMESIDSFVSRWHELYRANVTDWKGNIITKAP